MLAAAGLVRADQRGLLHLRAVEIPVDAERHAVRLDIPGKLGRKQRLAELARLAPGRTNPADRDPPHLRLEWMELRAQPPSVDDRLRRDGDEVVRLGLPRRRGEHENR